MRTGSWPALVERGRRAGRLRATVLLAALLLASACGSEVVPAPKSSAPPNLLLVTVDTLRADRLACYGGAGAAGVALCELFRGGLRYTWAFSTAPSTAPSVASILTSRYARDHGVTQHAQTRLSDEVATVAELLSAAGYATGAVLSNPVLRAERKLDQGFDFYEDRMTRAERNRPMLLERTAAEATDLALEWARGVERPWFLWVHYQDPHGPYDPPESAVGRDSKADAKLPLLADESGWRGIPRYQMQGGLRTLRAYAWRYDQEIQYFEGELVRLVAALDALGSPPAILLTADHGEAFGEDEFYLAHGHSVGLDQIRVPMLWRPVASDRGSGAARVATLPVSTLDVSPTLLEAAGVAIPESFQGRPLPRQAAALTAQTERSIFAEHRLRIAVIDGGIYYARDRQPLEEPVADAVSGGLLPPLPPRIAELAADGRAPDYQEVPISEVAADPARRERLVGEFLAAAARERELSEELDPVSRDALRALGYLE